jgi:hypothetical protein
MIFTTINPTQKHGITLKKRFEAKNKVAFALKRGEQAGKARPKRIQSICKTPSTRHNCEALNPLTPPTTFIHPSRVPAGGVA